MIFMDKEKELQLKLTELLSEIIEYEKTKDNLTFEEAKEFVSKLTAFCSDSIKEKKEIENPYYVIIAGSRNFNDYELLKEKALIILSKKLPLFNVVIVSGEANGADKLGERFAEEHNLGLIKMPADWDKYGKSAGYKRNQEMAEIANACIVFWDGESFGSKHMIDIAKEKGIPVKVINF